MTPDPGALYAMTASVPTGELAAFGKLMEQTQRALTRLGARLDEEVAAERGRADKAEAELAALGDRIDTVIAKAVADERERILAIAERLKEPHTGPRSNGAEYAVPLSFLRAELTREPQCDRTDCGQDAEWGTP